MKEIVTVAEIERQYPEEWVLMEITREHRDDQRVAGRLIAHNPDRSAVHERHRRFRAEHPRAVLYQFFTGDLVADKDVVVILRWRGLTVFPSCPRGR